MAFELFTQSVIGQRHINHNTEKEDFSLKLQTPYGQLILVADGHGDPNCCRSAYGSEQVCRVAAECLTEFAKTVAERDLVTTVFAKSVREKYIRKLIESILARWNNAVRLEYEQHPLSEEEKAAASEFMPFYSQNKSIEHIYGTTLIAGLITDDYILLLQQGDGRCDVFDENGNVSQPIPWDENCEANITTSVCDSNAREKFRYTVINPRKTPVSAIVMVSDGIEDSYPSYNRTDPMSRLHIYNREILMYCAENGIEQTEQYLLSTLPDMTKNFSTDDCSISAAIDIQQINSLHEKFTGQNETDAQIEKLMTSFCRSSEKLRSMARKITYLQNAYNTAQKNLEKTRAEYNRLEELRKFRDYNQEQSYSGKVLLNIYDKLNDLLKSLGLKDGRQAEICLADSEEKYKKAQEAYDQISKEYLPYRSQYDAVVKLKQDSRTELLNYFPADVLDKD